MATRKDNTNASILKEAEFLINGPRAKSYGPAHISFSRIALIASTLTGLSLTPRDAINFLKAVKLSRQRNLSQRDNQVDLAAYCELERHIEKAGVADLKGENLIAHLIEHGDIKEVSTE